MIIEKKLKDNLSAEVTEKERAINITTDNALFNCAAPIFSIITQLQLYRYQFKAEKLREFIINHINQLEERLLAQQINQQTISDTKYILCAMLDELILNQDLAEEKQLMVALWSEKGLVSTYFNQAWGGEQFFNILERAYQDAEDQSSLLEIILLCLNLGFAGKYRNLPQSEQHLFRLKQKLYQALTPKRNPNTSSSIWLFGDTKLTTNKKSFLSAKSIIFIAISSLVIIYGLFSWQLDRLMHPILQLLNVGH